MTFIAYKSQFGGTGLLRIAGRIELSDVIAWMTHHAFVFTVIQIDRKSATIKQ